MPSSSPASINVLVYDHDRDVHELVAVLCRDLKVKCYHFTSGAEALGFYKQKRIDLIVADINDQAVDGVTIAKRIGATQNQTPIILLASPLRRNRMNGLERNPMIAVVPKPVEPLKLAKHLAEAVQWKMDLASQQVSPPPMQSPEAILGIVGEAPEAEDSGDIEDVRLELESAYALIEQLREQSAVEAEQRVQVEQSLQRSLRVVQERDAEIKRLQQVLEALQNRLTLAEQQVANAQANAGGDMLDDESLNERLAYIEESEERLMARAQELFEKETELAHREEALIARERVRVQTHGLDDDDDALGWGADEDGQLPLEADLSEEDFSIRPAEDDEDAPVAKPAPKVRKGVRPATAPRPAMKRKAAPDDLEGW